MKIILTPQNMRHAERALMNAGIDEIQLMKRAAQGIFAAASPWSGKVGILCGGGNNAGNGYALALLLMDAGAEPILLRASDKLTDASAHYYAECRQRSISECMPSEIDRLRDCTRVVDCLFGIGFHGILRTPYDAIAEWCNSSGIPVIAADIPSGLDALTGSVEGAIESSVIKASLTVAIGAYKPGHFFGSAPDVCGTLALAPIGIEALHDPNEPATAHLIEGVDIAPLFSPRPHCTHKGSYGTSLLLGGCNEYSGAPKLANLAATSLASLRSGCGIARLAVPASLTHAVAPYLLESTLCPMPQHGGKLIFHPSALDGAFASVRAAAIGMGWGRSAEYADILDYILSHFNIPTVIDADGLNTLAESNLSMLKQKRSAPIILTPHPKEFERLSGLPMTEILADPISSARAFASVNNCIILLKGSSTVITDGDRVLVTNRGCGGMATAGSGDVLSGILSALLAWSPLDPLLTVAAGAYIAGLAGEIAETRVGSVSMIASDTVAALPEAVRQLIESC